MLTIDNSQHMFELKYRPGTIEECILPARDKQIFASIVQSGRIPHLILHSNSPGTGKTTVAQALCSDTNAHMLFVNGADCKIDFIRNELTQFASSLSIDGRHKVIVLDEFDRAGLGEAQRHLKTFMEAYGDNCSIIITANNLESIIKPLQSRARVIQFQNPTAEDTKSMMLQMIRRCMDICKAENVEVEDPKVLGALVKKNFPDFRKVTNTLDFYSSTKKIDAGILNVVLENRDLTDLIEAIKNKEVSKFFALADKYASSYSTVIEQLMDTIYPIVTDQSKVQLFEIMGENNQLFNLAASQKVHIRMLLARLSFNMVWL